MTYSNFRAILADASNIYNGHISHIREKYSLPINKIRAKDSFQEKIHRQQVILKKNNLKFADMTKVIDKELILDFNKIPPEELKRIAVKFKAIEANLDSYFH